MGKAYFPILSALLFALVAILSFWAGNILMGWVAAIWGVAFMLIYIRARAHGGGEA